MQTIYSNILNMYSKTHSLLHVATEFHKVRRRLEFKHFAIGVGFQKRVSKQQNKLGINVLRVSSQSLTEKPRSGWMDIGWTNFGSIEVFPKRKVNQSIQQQVKSLEWRRSTCLRTSILFGVNSTKLSFVFTRFLIDSGSLQKLTLSAHLSGDFLRR